MIKGRYDDENLKWIPLIIMAVFALPFLCLLYTSDAADE